MMTDKRLWEWGLAMKYEEPQTLPCTSFDADHEEFQELICYVLRKMTDNHWGAEEVAVRLEHFPPLCFQPYILQRMVNTIRKGA